MHRALLLAGVLTAGGLAVPPAAHAAPRPSGQGCGLVAAADPQVEGSMTGEVSGGPMLLTDDTDGTVIHSGSLTCTVQVNASTHAGADAGSVTGPSTPFAAVAAGTLTYATTPGDNVYLCTRVDIDGTTLYYADANDPLIEGHWSTSSSASCALLTTVEVGDVGPVDPPPPPPPPAVQVPVYCDYASSSGTATFDPGLSTTPTPNDYLIAFEVDCAATRGLSDSEGHYSVLLEGTASGNGGAGETCSGGNSHNGVITGTGPEGSLAGTYTYYRIGAHYWVTGSFTSGTRLHNFTLWLDLVPGVSAGPAPGESFFQWAGRVFGQVCGVTPITQSGVIGHGTIRHPGDAGDPAWPLLDVAVAAVAGVFNGE